MTQGLKFLARAVTPVALLCAAAPSSSQIKTATYSGVITSGTDNSGIFGVAGSDLSGLAFSVAYTYDLGQGFRTTTLPGYDAIFGGGMYGFPVTKVIITINAIGRDNDSGYAQELVSQPTANTAFAAVESYYGGPSNYTSNSLDASGLTSLSDNLSVTGSGSGYFVISHYQPGLAFFPTDASGNFDTQALVVTGVPEPTAWGLMLGGFSAMGTLLRRRRELAAA